MEAVAEITAAVKNVPALRFPEFEGEWEEIKFEDFCTLQRGFDLTNATRVDGKVPVYSSSGLSYYHNVVKVKGPGVVTGRKGIVGKVFFIEEDFWPHDTTLWVKNFNSNDEKFVYWFLLRFRLERFDASTSVPTLNRNNVHGIKIRYPTLPEQQKIASSLSAADDKIQQLSNKKALLEKYKKGVMQQVFSQKIRFKDDNGNDFPEWEVKKAKEVFKNHSNKKHNGDLPILAITQDKGTVLRDSIDIDIKSSEASIKSYKIIEEGDFIISLRSFQGGIEYSDITGICSPAYTILKATIGIDTTFFKYYFKKESFIKQLSNTVVGIRDGKQISYDAFSGMKLLFPSVAEQSKIGKFLTSIDDKIDLIIKQLQQAQQFKKGLLQQMFV